ncbi:MAG: hypothetical protein IIY21_04080 [Clostridiales bacterium]|nr:hypothetical protein [Clostridiales bacterium]MBQ1570832.1 hypothetical protein [Clostridiales bacterium]
MKLIIDIPYGLKDVYEHGNVTALDVEEMKRALQNGTPIPDNATNGDVLDKIRAEIIKQFEGCYLEEDMTDERKAEHKAYENVLRIIDKYIK